MSEQYRQMFQSALRSYNAMETTKRRHFEYLTLVESKKKKFNLDATPEETHMLELLLRDHDEEVRAFKDRCDLLKSNEPAAHAALFDYLSKINSALVPAVPDNKY